MEHLGQPRWPHEDLERRTWLICSRVLPIELRRVASGSESTRPLTECLKADTSPPDLRTGGAGGSAPLEDGKGGSGACGC